MGQDFGDLSRVRVWPVKSAFDLVAPRPVWPGNAWVASTSSALSKTDKEGALLRSLPSRGTCRCWVPKSPISRCFARCVSRDWYMSDQGRAQRAKMRPPTRQTSLNKAQTCVDTGKTHPICQRLGALDGESIITHGGSWNLKSRPG